MNYLEHFLTPFPFLLVLNTYNFRNHVRIRLEAQGSLILWYEAIPSTISGMEICELLTSGVGNRRKFSAHISFNFIVTLTMPSIFGSFQACNSHPEPQRHLGFWWNDTNTCIAAPSQWIIVVVFTTTLARGPSVRAILWPRGDSWRHLATTQWKSKCLF